MTTARQVHHRARLIRQAGRVEERVMHAAIFAMVLIAVIVAVVG